MFSPHPFFVLRKEAYRFMFSYDGPVLTFLSRFWNCVWLSLLFLLCSIPVFTIGLSYSALYYTMRKALHYERGYVTPAFFHAIRTNFKQAAAAGLMFLAAWALLFADYSILRRMLEAGSGFGFLSALSVAVLIVAFLLLLYALWVFAYLSRFQDSLKVIFRNSAYLLFTNAGKTLLAGILVAACVLVCFLEPILTVLLPSLCVWMISILFERAFRANMSEEQLASERTENEAWMAEGARRWESKLTARQESLDRIHGKKNDKEDS